MMKNKNDKKGIENTLLDTFYLKFTAALKGAFLRLF